MASFNTVQGSHYGIECTVTTKGVPCWCAPAAEARRQVMKKEVFKRLIRLAKGVAVAGRVIRVLPVDQTGEKWQAAVLVPHEGGSANKGTMRGKVLQLEELIQGDLHLVRKITCAYFPSACRHFGAALGYSA